MGKLHRVSVRCSLALVLAALVAGARAQSFEPLVSFDGTDEAAPLMSLVQGRDGNLYGTTSEGGSNGCYDGTFYTGCGTIFRVTPAGEVTTLYEFCESECSDGASPFAGLVLASDGNFYGTTFQGGNLCGTVDGICGTIFRVSPAGKLTTLYAFCAQAGCNDGAGPLGLVLGADGNLYGETTIGGANCNFEYYVPCGTIFRITPAGNFTTVYSFCQQVNKNGCPDGSSPTGLVQASDGSFYGTTTEGGMGNCQSDCGTIFKITPAGVLTTLYDFCVEGFPCSDGYYPAAGLALAKDGSFYGTTLIGGTSDGGTTFRVTSKGMLTTLSTFCPSRGSEYACLVGNGPSAPLMQATDGNLYGTTMAGQVGSDTFGTIFQMTPRGRLAVVQIFDGTNGAIPQRGGLFQHTNGLLYGSAPDGGSGNCGEAFSYGSCGLIFEVNLGQNPFVAFVISAGRVAGTAQILGQGFTGASAVSFNGVPATFEVRADTFLTATVPRGATTGYVTVTTPTGVLESNVEFRVVS